jgi:hypothetical protein
MSWSVSGIGRPVAVAAKLAADLSAYKCVDPEESVKQAAAALLAAALAAQDPVSVVKVSASGSQGTSGNSIYNSVRIEVEPVYGFIE